MVNYCYNYLEINGSKEDILRLEKCIKSKDGNKKWDLSNVISVDTDDEGYYKVKDIYATWGTKWFLGEDFINNGTSATLSFDTAWSPSLPVTLEMSRRFNLKINHYYEEQGSNFEGDYNVKDGEVIFEEEREYKHYCSECGVKDEDDNLCYDEEEGEYYHLKCRDKFAGIVEEKIKKIKQGKEIKN